MAHRRVGQLGFVDKMVSGRKRRGEDVLERIAALIDWAAIEARLGEFYPSRAGEPGYPPVVMFRVLLLQGWHGLSDPEMEAALDDRFSFRRFAGLSLEDEVPDHSTIWRFRERLAERGLDQALFAEIERQLDRAGFVIKRGTLIDASLVKSAARRPKMDEGKLSKTDPDARFGTANERGRYVFGYKMHVAVDQASGLVRAAELTPANIQEIDLALGLVRGDETCVYGDRGYDSRRLHDHLAELGIANGIMRRNARHRPLTAAEIERNHVIAAIRRPVEKVFGTFKRHYRLDRMRYFAMARNRVQLMIIAMCYNLRRMAVLDAA